MPLKATARKAVLYEARQPRQCRYQSPPIAIWRLGPSGAKSPTWVAGWLERLGGIGILHPKSYFYILNPKAYAAR